MRITRLLLTLLALIVCKSNLAQHYSDDRQLEHLKEQFSFHNGAGNLDSVLFYVNQILDELPSNKQKAKIQFGCSKAETLKSMGNFLEALEVLYNLVQNCNSRNDDLCKVCSNAHYQLALLYGNVREYRSAIRNLELMCDDNKSKDFYYYMAYFHIRMNDTLIGLKYSETWVNICREKGGHELIDAYNTYGLMANLTKSKELAKENYLNAIDLIQQDQLDTSSYAYIWGNLGRQYFESSELDSAYEYSLIDAKFSENYPNKSSYATATIALCEIDFLQKDYYSVIERANYAMSTYKKDIKLRYTISLLRILKESYLMTNQMEKYVSTSKRWEELSANYNNKKLDKSLTLKNRITQLAVTNLEERHAVESKLKNHIIEKKKIEVKSKQKSIYILILCFVLFVSMILFLNWRRRLLQAKKRALDMLELETAKQEKEIMRLKFEEEANQSRLLTVELLMKKEYTEQIVDELKQIDSISPSQVKAFEISIQNALEVKSLRAHLQISVGDLSGQFQEVLERKHPDLTDNEIKLAGFVIMKMSNKEIAISKGISDVSVKKNKYRFKKKLGLNPEDDLTEYLISLV